MNIVMLTVFCGATPMLRENKSGHHAIFPLYTREGSRKEKHRCVIYDARADQALFQFTKGTYMSVQGYLHHYHIEHKARTQYFTEVVVEHYDIPPQHNVGYMNEQFDALAQKLLDHEDSKNHAKSATCQQPFNQEITK